MKIVEGVYLHFIQTEKFKTHHLTCRFSCPLTEDNRARRSLVAQMLATANQAYPTSRLFRQRLAELYGAHFSTKVSSKGMTHMLDIDISFASNNMVLTAENILDEVLEFLNSVLFQPLISIEQYQSKTFKTEQANLINYLEADKEDLFYYSDLELDKLYFNHPYLQESLYSTADKVAAENSYTAYQEFRRMMAEDRIDFFLVGSIEEYPVLQKFHQLPLKPRQTTLTYFYQQDLSNVIEEKIERRSTSQSILNLAYHSPIYYGDEDYPALLVFNGLLGLFPHSLLFTEIREKSSLAYSISSQVNPYTGYLKIQAGISKADRQKVLRLVTQQLMNLKTGRFSTQLLGKTKKMLLNSSQLALDNHKSLVELRYNQVALPNEFEQMKELRQAIQSVDKAAIRSVASKIRLQAIYFMEGED